MTITMDDSQIKSLEQIRLFLKSSQDLQFKGLSRKEKYMWIEQVVDRFNYFSLGKKNKGMIRVYLMRMTGFSQSQMTRLIARKLMEDKIDVSTGDHNSFPNKYSILDKELLAETDNVHGRLSGPATKKIFERQFYVYGDEKFERLKNISSSHIYNLRFSRTYKLRAQTFTRTKTIQKNIGIRRKPNPLGVPGYLRVDTVHQGDLDSNKGVYHINLIDEITQWENIVCVEKISESYLVPVLEKALETFPFRILGFHSDNGSEFINGIVAGILNKLLIEQTKSRSGRTNDNALVEGKNGSIIRKHMGYWHIEQRYAPLINRFYIGYFNVYLNYHRPCGFPTVTVDEKGRRRKKYETYQTPYERLKSLKNAGRYLRDGVTFEELDKAANEKTDNKFAHMMQEAKDRLFKKLMSAKNSKIFSNGGVVPEIRRHPDDIFHAHS